VQARPAAASRLRASPSPKLGGGCGCSVEAKPSTVSPASVSAAVVVRLRDRPVYVGTTSTRQLTPLQSQVPPARSIVKIAAFRPASGGRPGPARSDRGQAPGARPAAPTDRGAQRKEPLEDAPSRAEGPSCRRPGARRRRSGPSSLRARPRAALRRSPVALGVPGLGGRPVHHGWATPANTDR